MRPDRPQRGADAYRHRDPVLQIADDMEGRVQRLAQLHRLIVRSETHASGGFGVIYAAVDGHDHEAAGVADVRDALLHRSEMGQTLPSGVSVAHEVLCHDID